MGSKPPLSPLNSTRWVWSHPSGALFRDQSQCSLSLSLPPAISPVMGPRDIFSDLALSSLVSGMTVFICPAEFNRQLIPDSLSLISGRSNCSPSLLGRNKRPCLLHSKPKESSRKPANQVFLPALTRTKFVCLRNYLPSWNAFKPYVCIVVFLYARLHVYGV